MYRLAPHGLMFQEGIFCNFMLRRGSKTSATVALATVLHRSGFGVRGDWDAMAGGIFPVKRVSDCIDFGS